MPGAVGVLVTDAVAVAVLVLVPQLHILVVAGVGRGVSPTGAEGEGQ